MGVVRDRTAERRNGHRPVFDTVGRRFRRQGRELRVQHACRHGRRRRAEKPERPDEVPRLHREERDMNRFKGGDMQELET